MQPDFQAVQSVLLTYLDGLYYSDTARLKSVLHPQARYVCATGEELVNLSMQEYFTIVDKRPSPASRNQERRDSIVSIEFAGPKTATARLHCAVGEKYFTDALTLIHTQGQWWIISKVFHYDLAS